MRGGELSGSLGRWWLARSLRSKGLLVLALPLTMLMVAAAVFFFAGAQADAAQRAVAHTREVEAQLAAVRSLVSDGETGIRGFLATGDEAFLEPTANARERLPAALDTLAGQLADDPVQVARVGQLREALPVGYQTQAPRGLGPGSAPDAVRGWLLEQKASTDALRVVLASMVEIEDRRLAARLAERDAWRSRARIGTGAALALGIAGGLLGMWGFTFGVARRLERLQAGTERIRDGQVSAVVDPGRDEIGVLSRRLDEVATRWLLWQREARAAREAAEAASRAKNEFLSRMSHELRTPLNAVLGFAQLLEMDLPAEQQDSVSQIRRAGRHLLDLINEVLDIAKIEAGHLTLSPETVRVSDLIEEAVELMGPIASAAGIAVHAAPGHACECHVRADRQRSKQVLLNLMSNAVKYNHTGGTVRVRCRAVDEETAAIEVEDSGIGIAEHDLQRLFVPFERLGAAQSEVEGTGVGLALSQRLAEAMGGRIDVASAVGQGSTFTFRLPAAADPLEAHIPAQGSPGRGPGQPGTPAASPVHTVLSIEDNLANTRLLQQIVARRPGWQIITAAQGQLGLDLAAVSPPQLILLDLHLPDMPGLQVLRRLKAMPATAQVPVAVVSADATPGQIKRLRATGAVAYVTKPIDVSQILDLLDRAAATGAGRA